MIIKVLFRSYLNCLVVFPIVFNLSVNFAIRSSWSEPQSAPSLVFFSDCIEPLYFQLWRISIWFQHWPSGMSMCRVISCIVGKGCLLWSLHSLGKTVWSASFCTPRQNLPVIPGISWLPIFAFQPSVMKGASFLVLVLEGLVGLHRIVQLHLLWH